MSTQEETREVKLSRALQGTIPQEYIEQRALCREIFHLWREKMLTPYDNGQEYFPHYAYSFFSFRQHYDDEAEDAFHLDEWENFFGKVSLATNLIVWLGTNVGYATYKEALAEYQKQSFTSGGFSAHMMLASSRGRSPLHLFDLALFGGQREASREEIKICLITLSFFEMDESVEMMEKAHQKVFPSR